MTTNKHIIFEKTLLDPDAKAWVYAVEVDNLGPLSDWIKLKQLIINQTFKPANSLTFLRDQSYQLKQTDTIFGYIKKFLKKLN